MSIFCYMRHINAWREDTAELTLEERGIYSELIDWFYFTNGRLPSDIKKIHRLLGVQSQSERRATAKIINQFFNEKDGFLFQNGCVKQLKVIHDKSEKARASALSKHSKNKDIGLANGSANVHADAMLTKNKEQREVKETEVSTSVKKKPIQEKLSIEPMGFSDFWEKYPRQRRGNRSKALIAYQDALKRYKQEEIHEGLIRYAVSDEVTRGWAKGAAAWLNDDRFKTDYSIKPSGGNGANGTRNAPVSFAETSIDVLNSIERNRAVSGRPVRGDDDNSDDYPF